MKKQPIQLSDHFTYGRLIRFALPSICMMIFTSIYGIVDGFFISNIVGKTAFASVNLIIPFLQILGGVGAMLGVGGSALVAKTLGEGDVHLARRYFTMMMYLMLGSSVVFTGIGIAVLRPVAYLFGATDAMIGDVMTYGTICLLFNTALHAQYIPELSYHGGKAEAGAVGRCRGGRIQYDPGLCAHGGDPDGGCRRGSRHRFERVHRRADPPFLVSQQEK